MGSRSRIYHHYLKWEDYKNGMWRLPNKTEENQLLKQAVEFTSDHVRYGEAMIRVIEEWKFSCEQNLTDPNINRKAWLGHAACSLELGLPENIVRKAWKYLTNEQRFLANEAADRAILSWENRVMKIPNQLNLFEE